MYRHKNLLITKANPVLVQTFDGRVKSLIAVQIIFAVFVLPDSVIGVVIFEFWMNGNFVIVGNAN